MATPLALAQITPDATLGAEGSVVSPGVAVRGDVADLIEGGAVRGGNLFHSFLEFNIDEGQRVYFANPAGIESILSRITGGDPSAIFGTLGVDGAADLFLINPNGIVFGENAALDIQGSFYASTAEAIPLGDGVYSATAPEQSSLLTVNPSALFSSYLSNASGDIENRGQLAAAENLTLAGNQLDLQGQVAAGGDLTLLGNTVQIRDAVDTPFVGFAGGDLLVQGNEQVDIVALSHPDSGLYSYGDMVLRSANPVGGDAHYWSGGSFRVETLDGSAGNLFSPIDPIVRTFGDVVIGQYTGTSLHILAGGAVTIGGATITAPDTGPLGIDFLQESIQLSDGTVVEIDGATQPTLDVRAGVAPEAIGVPPLELLTGFNPATDRFFGRDTTEIPSSADITIGDVAINAPDGLVLLTNQYQPNPQIKGGNILIESQLAPTTGLGGIFAGSLILGLPGGGTVFLDARNDISVLDSIITTLSSEDSGSDIVILAGGTLRLDSPNGRPTGVVTGTPTTAISKGGDIRVVTNDLEMANGAQLNASTLGPGDAGRVIVAVRETASFDGVNRLNGSLFFGVLTGIVSSVRSSAIGNGGDIVLSARTLEVTNGAQLTASTFGMGDAGNVILTIGETARFDGVNPLTGLNASGARSVVEQGGVGAGGNVELSAANLEVTNGAQLIASTFGVGNSGNVILTIADTARFDGVNPVTGLTSSGTFSTIELNGVGQGGNIQLSAANLEVTNGAVLTASTSGAGNAGNVILTVTDTARFDGVNPITGVSPGGVFSNVNVGGEGTGGNIDLSASSLEVINGANLSTSTFGFGDAGDITLKITGIARFDGVNPITGVSPGGVFSSINPGGEGTGGNIDLSASSLEVTNGANLSTSTFGFGDAGDITLKITGIARFDGVNPITGVSPGGVFSSVNPGGEGTGGNIDLSAASLEVTNGSGLLTSTFGFGDAGDITLKITGIARFDGSSSIQSGVLPNGIGNAGGIEIISNVLEMTNGSELAASTIGQGDAGDINIYARERLTLRGTGLFGQPSSINSFSSSFTGRGGNIWISTPNLQIYDGAVLFGSTLNVQPGGSIVLSLGHLSLLDGGQIVTTSLGSGPAGSIHIDVTNSILISGTDASFNVRLQQLPILAIALSPQSSLSVRSSGTGAAGNIIIGELGNTPRLELNNGGQIIAESAAVDGGNIVINLNDLLLMRNGSLISTTAGTAQAEGNGGNITISAPFIIAIPAENSDIAADAFEDSGGNVTITARGIFGIEPRSERTPLSDITASSELGLSGVVTLNTLDTSAIENSLISLADTITDTAALTAGSCIARTDESLGSFAITGSGGLPQRPGDTSISSYPTGTVRTGADATATLQEPDGVYQLPDGRLVLSRACE